MSWVAPSSKLLRHVGDRETDDGDPEHHEHDQGREDEAWALLYSCTAVDLVFSEIRLPGIMTGRQLAPEIKSHFPHLPVVFTSWGVNAVELGQAFLLKPYVLEETEAQRLPGAGSRKF